MEQMRRYGIPLSVTLAQGILESSNGQSRLAQNENNHFGITTPEWIAEGTGTACIPMTSRTRSSAVTTVWAIRMSITHASRREQPLCPLFLASPDDYKGWTLGLEKAGYATGGHYADSLQRIIEQNGLQKYDRRHAGDGSAGKAVRCGREPAPGSRKCSGLFVSGGTERVSFRHPHRSVCGKTPRTGQNECTQAWTSDVTTAMQCWRRNKAARSSLSETNRSRWNTPVRTAAKYSVPTKTSARYS